MVYKTCFYRFSVALLIYLVGGGGGGGVDASLGNNR